MKILLVNKFLYPKGGAETYVLGLGALLTERGHTVQYFGLENPKNTVGNAAGEYVSSIDFSVGMRKNLTAPLRIIYSAEAAKKMGRVLNSFQPDVVHLNNIQFHLTPSIILAVDKYRKATGRSVKIVYTAHDYQLVCPSHGLFDSKLQVCVKCLGGHYTHCLRNKCMKNSRLKSLLAMLDAYFWRLSRAYKCIDTIICPSRFLKGKLDTEPRFADKTVALHNFVLPPQRTGAEKGDYVLEFGHLSKDKGTYTLLEAARRMPDVRFVFAGFGSAVEDIAAVPNAEYVGFKTGSELAELIQGALVSVCPSEWHENCPYSVIESQLYMTPAVVSNMGGVPEIVQDGRTGLVFKAGDADDLEAKLRYILQPEVLKQFTANCAGITYETPDSYYHTLMNIYGEDE